MDDHSRCFLVFFEITHAVDFPFYFNFDICCFLAVKFLETECKAEVVSINIPELEVCTFSL